MNRSRVWVGKEKKRKKKATQTRPSRVTEQRRATSSECDVAKSKETKTGRELQGKKEAILETA
jgi:hypothetical protein